MVAGKAATRREKVRAAYKKFIGRNHYSQAKRDYCLKAYKDGKYYSDCSSSVSYAYKAAGEGFGILNTVGMWTSGKLRDVPVTINKNGTIANPEVLRVGDMLLFAGNDPARKAWGYVGHVEMVGEISDGKVMLYGHGSGLAKRHEMNAYLKSRRSTKSATALGHRGLIRVRRFIQDDAVTGGDGSVIATGDVNIRTAPNTDGRILGVLKKGQRLPYQGVSQGGWHLVVYMGENAWVSGKYAEVEK